MKPILEKLEFGRSAIQTFNIIGPDYDEFRTVQKACFKIKEKVLVFDNCCGVQFGPSPDLLDEQDQVMVEVALPYNAKTLYELQSSLWKDLVNKQLQKTPYLTEGDKIQMNLKHYFFQVSDYEYWHILSDQVITKEAETETVLRKEFETVKTKVFLV